MPVHKLQLQQPRDLTVQPPHRLPASLLESQTFQKFLARRVEDVAEDPRGRESLDLGLPTMSQRIWNLKAHLRKTSIPSLYLPLKR
jgi:hypothetical protein